VDKHRSSMTGKGTSLLVPLKPEQTKNTQAPWLSRWKTWVGGHHSRILRHDCDMH